MAGELAGIETDGAMPDGFTVERAEDVESRRAWGQVCAAGTGFPGEIAERFSGFEAGMNGFDPERHFRFTGFASGVPVATSALVLDSDVAGIYAVATLPEARRKGYGVAVTLAALTEAKRRGYEVATLQASDMGFPLYEKLGFRKVCWFDMYL